MLTPTELRRAYTEAVLEGRLGTAEYLLPHLDPTTLPITPPAAERDSFAVAGTIDETPRCNCCGVPLKQLTPTTFTMRCDCDDDDVEWATTTNPRDSWREDFCRGT